ncbi:hypothetical protein [Rhizobium tubonense]|uniref:Uncharacterized protein n=1 Tax=Rhizobium tubonense TaxID=484088 RepID=A0A2W4CYH4_9HYPH|nr:hypothetical protein [Rhizobium tubonense]PZM10344.1 hypothetical protein CPY51_23625 [Rhizobium tubonense]
MRFATFTLGISFAILASSAMAQNFPGAPGIAVLNGKCAKLVVGKLDDSKNCKGQLASVTTAEGAVTFIFSANGKMLGFEGDGTAIKPASNGNARMPIAIVSSGVGAKMTGQVKAAGFCTFGNPYAGKPTVVECTAETKGSSFTGSFRTNGKPPQPK